MKCLRILTYYSQYDTTMIIMQVGILHENIQNLCDILGLHGKRMHARCSHESLCCARSAFKGGVSPLVVFNAESEQRQAEIIAIKSKHVYLRLVETVPLLEESPLSVHLAQGISRGEGMDYAIQKAVELGVAEISPLLTERCGVKLDERRMKNRVVHWQSVVVHACEQSGRAVIPRSHAPQSYFTWLEQGFSWVAVLSVRCKQKSPYLRVR